MTPRNAFSGSVMALLALAFLPSTALSQQKTFKEQLVGTWTLVSAEAVDASGTKMPLVAGPDVRGLLIFTQDGRLSFQVIADSPKVAANDRMKMTADEMRAAAQGVLSYFGTYSVDEADKSFTMQIERSTFSNQVGRPAKRNASISGDELRVTNASRLAGGQTNLVWKRAK
jgi:hypothetical protein